jgi:hypothetical protein
MFNRNLFRKLFLTIKSSLLLVIFYLIIFTLKAQTGIGTATPHTSAKLDVSSTNKGFLPPRVTLTSTSDITTIPNPATALLVYNTGNNVNLSAGYYYWSGSAWTKIGNNGSILASNTVTISATGTAPSTGTRTIDRTFAVDNGATRRITLQLGYEGLAAGSGDYLFSLPSPCLLLRAAATVGPTSRHVTISVWGGGPEGKGEEVERSCASC